MNFTAYGKALAATERRFTSTEIGATGHMLACQYDTGLQILLTGTDASGRSFQRSASSVFGAYMQAQAAWGIERAWHLKADGTRKLLFRR